MIRDSSDAFGPRRLMIVEDDEDQLASLSDLLELEGDYEIIGARTPAAAQQALREFAADVILIDVRLGRDSGLALIAPLRRIRPEALCVMMTAHTSAEIVIEALQQGAYDYVRKGFHPEELFATLDRCFERVHLERERSLARAALAESEARFRAILNNANAVIYLKDLEGRYLFANRAFEQLLGLSDEQLRGRTDHDLFPAEVATLVRNNDMEVLRLGRALELEEEGPVEGRRRTFFSLKFPLLDRESRPYAVCGISTDITARKQAEAALRASESRYRSLVEHAAEAIVLLDVDSGCFVDVNTRAVDLFGYDRDELLRIGLRDLLPPTQPDGAQSLHFIAAKLDLALQGDTSAFECVLCNVARVEIPCELRLVSVPENDRRLLRGSITDIRRRKAMEVQLIQAQKMEAIGQLAGGMAHDFNNLLTIIIGCLDVVQGQLAADDDQLGPFLARATEAAERGSTLIRRLLAFSRQQVLIPTITNVNTLIEGLLNLVRGVVGKRISIELALTSDPWLTKVDVGQLESAILNLIINARDAMPNGGKLRIETRNTCSREGSADPVPDVPPGEYCEVRVRDSGVGIDADVLAHVFEPFFTTKEIGRGSGLGLSMVYGFVRQSGGHVLLSSVKNHGTVVTLYLPRHVSGSDAGHLDEQDYVS